MLVVVEIIENMSDHPAREGGKLIFIKTIIMAAAKFSFFRCLKNQENLISGFSK